MKTKSHVWRRGNVDGLLSSSLGSTSSSRPSSNLMFFQLKLRKHSLLFLLYIPFIVEAVLTKVNERKYEWTVLIMSWIRGLISNKETFIDTEGQQHCNVTMAPHKVCLHKVLTLTKHFLTSEKIRNLSAGWSPAQKSAGADVIGVAIAASMSRLS